MVITLPGALEVAPAAVSLYRTDWASHQTAGCLQVMFYCNHWSACIFYFIARQQGFTDSTWVGANANLVLATDVKILRCESCSPMAGHDR